MERDQAAVKNEFGGNDDILLDEEAQEDAASYYPRLKLSTPTKSVRSLGYFMKGLDEELIDINPEYQREVVWTDERMTGLIDSLMENYYVPPIILNRKTLPAENGQPKHVYVCVDGKQRLSSVKAFIEGKIPCHDHRGEKWYFCDAGGNRRKKILAETDQHNFMRKEFVSFEFKDLSPEQEEDLFSRVQMGVQLTVAEKMRARTGPWQELARCYVEDFPAVYSLLKDRTRAKDFQLTLSCFSQILECQCPTNASGTPTMKTSHTHLPKLLDNKGAVDDAAKSHLASVWNTFKDLINLDSNVFTNANKTLRGVQTFAPVEMVAVTVLISTYSESRNNKLLLGDIKHLRDELRENFVDLRLNVGCWKFIWEYIYNLESIRGAVDRSTIDRSVNPVSAPTPRAEKPESTLKRGQPTKPPNMLPDQDSPMDIKQEHTSASAMPSEDPRLLKRQRIDPGPTLRLDTASSMDTGLMSPAISPPTQFRGLPAQAPAGPSAHKPTTQKARRTPANKRPPPPAPLRKSSLPKSKSATLVEDQHRPSEANAFRVPVAPMVTTSAFPPIAPNPTTVTASSSSLNTAPRALPLMPNVANPQLGAKRSTLMLLRHLQYIYPSATPNLSNINSEQSPPNLAYSPTTSTPTVPHLTQPLASRTWFPTGGPIRSPSAQEIVKPSSPANVPPHAQPVLGQQYSRSAAPPARTPAKLTSFIDLTIDDDDNDDPENARQNILSQFGARASPRHEQQTYTPYTPRKPHGIGSADPDCNNPYGKRKLHQ
ncbi:hypothetical protein P280DRAFT_508442 [Massarina eburnea CBS 473.64]|uniref:GmrSD restriction endonucleases N-terminal domain-containing protein n=1 Tax=Massarina eburnea CBS 473.64 TaxID=1395130 RepID=A0A6A6RVH4_9PLEO|nr:hypothetical protein P280DRAFT_508442 [Massarina eburnea CBS 473.64]